MFEDTRGTPDTNQPLEQTDYQKSVKVLSDLRGGRPVAAHETIEIILADLTQDGSGITLHQLADLWLEAKNSVPPEQRFKQGFLLVLEKDCPHGISALTLVEAIKKRMTGDEPRDLKLLSDAAVFIMLKEHYPGESVRECLPKFQALVGKA